MSTANDMLQVLSSFETTSAPYALSFYGRLNAATGSCLINPYSYPTRSGETRRSIVLPNGAKFDPHQTYDAPQIPGEFVYNVILIPATAGSEGTEAAITGYYNDFAMQFLGLRGTLYGAAYNISSSTSATARLINVSMRWELPKQIPTTIGGVGSASPGVKSAIVTFTFDLLTNWSFTY